MMSSVLGFMLLVAFSSAESIVARFDLAPPTFRETPRWPDQSYYDQDGPPIQLNCKVSNVSHKLVWMKNGHVIDVVKDQLLLRDENQSLIFEDPKQFQSGSYKCLAYNSGGNISHSGNIVITARKQETRPTVIGTEPVNTVKHAEIGETVNISCTYDVGGSVEALMDLAVEWFKGKITVNDTSHTTYGVNNTAENDKISSLNIDKLQISDYGTYKCYGQNLKGNTSRLITIAPPPKKQNDFPMTLIIGCSVAGVVSMAIVVIVTIVRRRYKLRQKYEELEWLDPDANIYEVPDRKVEYDVFISYSSDDLKWVKDVLFYKLCDNGYNVCIDFKDFTPGVAIAENIIEAIYRSRKTIVLMSKNFLKSMWGQFELQQAHNRAIMQRSDVLILIKYDNSKVPAKLMGKTFLDWSDAKIQPHFWTRLFEAIGEPGKLEDTGGKNVEPDAGNEDIDKTVKGEKVINVKTENLDNEKLENMMDREDEKSTQDKDSTVERNEDAPELGVLKDVNMRNNNIDTFDDIVAEYEWNNADVENLINIHV